jgi:hypothetical protein
VRAFIHPRRREQFLSRLASPRTRRKLLDQLAHFRDLDPRFARRIPPGERTADKVYRRLKGLGAPATCYVLGSGELDGREIDLREALEAIVSQSFGDFLSCIPGRLGYFEGEEADERYILER